jgi:hypothetical protein
MLGNEPRGGTSVVSVTTVEGGNAPMLGLLSPQDTTVNAAASTAPKVRSERFAVLFEVADRSLIMFSYLGYGVFID